MPFGIAGLDQVSKNPGAETVTTGREMPSGTPPKVVTINFLPLAMPWALRDISRTWYDVAGANPETSNATRCGLDVDRDCSMATLVFESLPIKTFAGCWVAGAWTFETSMSALMRSVGFATPLKVCIRHSCKL